MKRRNFICLLLIVIIFFTGILLYFRSPLRQNKNYPILSGSFIQVDLAQNWDENDWNRELKYLTENKMQYLILTNIAFTENNITETVYQSNIPGTKKIYGNTDQVDLCLKAAEKSGMKVFLATDFNNAWWNVSINDTDWFKNEMNKTNLICNELYKRYHSKYPHAFYGWYFPYEVDNAKFNSKDAFGNLAQGININLNYLNSSKQRLPFLMSPFINSDMGTAKEYADNWKYFFSKVNLQKGDVFCPQDSVGSGGMDINQINPWFTALRKAVNTKKGLQLWANAETFDYVNNSSASLDRFINQLKLEQPCVDKIVSFSYSHYYSPNNINPGFNKAYSQYVKEGGLKNNNVPKPKNLTVSTIDKNEFKLTWNSPSRNDNIEGYKIYRNGVLIFNPVVQRKYGGQTKQFYLSVVDKPILQNNVRLFTYSVKSVDFYGNESHVSNTVTVASDTLKVFPILLSKGCNYTLSPKPDYNYDSLWSNKLTDSKFSSRYTVKDKAFLGWYNSPFNVQIDLKSIKQVSQFMIDYYRKPREWAMLPKSASIAVSEDGVNFIPVGLVRIPDVPFSERNGSKYPLYLTLNKPVRARYVKLTSIPEANHYIFIDEFQVRN